MSFYAFPLFSFFLAECSVAEHSKKYTLNEMTDRVYPKNIDLCSLLLLVASSSSFVASRSQAMKGWLYSFCSILCKNETKKRRIPTHEDGMTL